ncbi:g8594 [Coccomyxa elongata]
MDLTIAAQGVSLLLFFIRTSITAVLYLPYAILKCLTSQKAPATQEQDGDGSCVFYEGTVYHVRRKPIHNAFRYPVRIAVVDLDKPPKWWHKQAADHMTANEARAFAGTDGAVLLLTTPVSAGYTQNPISVYYCNGGSDGRLRQCIAEVTNTPWGERVTFLFRPEGQDVPKAMHVSPLMDMKSTWHIRAPLPGDRCRLEVSAVHPEMGPFFEARLTALRSTVAGRSETAGLTYLWRYGFMPHRVAFWIYWQALKLLWKGVPFFGYPSRETRAAAERMASNPTTSQNRHFVWRNPLQYPWNAA